MGKYDLIQPNRTYNDWDTIEQQILNGGGGGSTPDTTKGLELTTEGKLAVKVDGSTVSFDANGKLQSTGGLVSSVNGEIGDVVLSADDILAANTQSIQDNLERIDSLVEGNIDDIADLDENKQDKLTMGQAIELDGDTLNVLVDGDTITVDVDGNLKAISTDVVNVAGTDIDFSSTAWTFANKNLDIIDTHSTYVMGELTLRATPTSSVSGSVQVGQLKLKGTGVNVANPVYGGCYSSAVTGAGYAMNSSNAGLYLQLPTATTGAIYMSFVARFLRSDLVAAGVLS